MCEHFAFSFIQLCVLPNVTDADWASAVISLGVTAFLIVYILCQNARASSSFGDDLTSSQKRPHRTERT